MKPGDRAPYAGQLLGTQLAIQIGQLANACDEKIAAEAKRCADLATAEQARSAATLKAERAASANEITTLNQRLAKARQLAIDAEPPFYQKPWFVAPVVAVGTAVAVVWATHR